MTQSSYEGLQGHIPEHETPEIEGFAFEYPGSNTTIKIRIPEFTAVCPKTGLPDFGEIYIDYEPQELCLELKSLKEYMMSFRELGIFHEHVVNKMLNDCVKACDPKSMTITGKYNPRGGIFTDAIATYNKEGK